MTAVKPDSCTLSSDLGWSLGVLSRSYGKAVSAIFADVPGGARGYQVLAAAAGTSTAASSRWPSTWAWTGRS